MQVIRTVPGNHARGHFNQREIDVITQEVLPECTESGSIGIITPYRAQAEAINKTVGKDIASTVHKYQGRECDTIIMSMVDNSPTEFRMTPICLMWPFHVLRPNYVWLQTEMKCQRIPISAS